jgi:hypothetical protein
MSLKPKYENQQRTVIHTYLKIVKPIKQERSGCFLSYVYYGKPNDKNPDSLMVPGCGT